MGAQSVKHYTSFGRGEAPCLGGWSWRSPHNPTPYLALPDDSIILLVTIANREDIMKHINIGAVRRSGHRYNE